MSDFSLIKKFCKSFGNDCSGGDFSKSCPAFDDVSGECYFMDDGPAIWDLKKINSIIKKMSKKDSAPKITKKNHQMGERYTLMQHPK